MEQFPENHFRYFTMNSWTRSTSYAGNVKIHKLGLDHGTELRAYDFLDVRETFAEINDPIEAFARKHDYQWQVGFNGRDRPRFPGIPMVESR